MMTAEPQIIINRVLLTEAQAMTVRVALAQFALELEDDGEGEISIACATRMRSLYGNRLCEINAFMRKP